MAPPHGWKKEEVEEVQRWRGVRMALTSEEWIAKLSPDLQGLLDSRRVAKELQAALARNAIDSIPMLSAIAIDRAGLATVAKDLLGLDVSLGGDETIKFAQLFLAWQSASKRIKVQDEMDAESSVHKEPKPVPLQELQALRAKFEDQYYKMKETEIPARGSLEDLFEQLDAGELRPMALRHYGSKADDEDVEIGSLQLGKAGVVKIKRNKVETAAPSTLEEFRAKVVLMANHYLFAKFRYPNKQMLQRINPFTFLDYLGYITGKHVAQLESLTVDGVTLHKPSVKLILNYEYQMRKEVTDEVNQGTCMAGALARVVKNSDIRERHFSTPLAVTSAVQATQGPGKDRMPGGDRWQPYEIPKGKGKGKKGKGKHKGKGKQQETLHSISPDGRQICYAWNNKKEGCRGGCQRLHVCRICLDPKHPTYDHPAKDEEKKQE